MNFSDIELPSNRKFGFFFTVVFALIGAYFFYAAVSIAYSFLALAIVFLIVTLIKSEMLLPLNKLWMRFGLLLGLIVNPIVLGIIFFGVFTPVNLVMKIFGRDELRLKLSERSSYWKERSSGDERTDSFKNQF